MSRAGPDGPDLRATGLESRQATALRAADWLGLAATPTFALMALLTCVLDASAPAMLCSAVPGGSALSGMAPMYALMSAFHAAPWLKLLFGRLPAAPGA